MGTTMLNNLVNPEVMADMISATLPKRIKFSPIANIDTTLVGNPGDTITVPKYAYIGDAIDVAEGVALGTTVLTASTTTLSVKKAGKAVEITDEAVLSGYGDPLGQSATQLAMSISAKIDNDCYDALCTAPLVYDGTANAISYNEVVKANAVFADESDVALNKAMFINPAQEMTLRLDSNFIDRTKYGGEVMMTGVIGMIAGCQIVKSKKVKLVKYTKDNSTGTITIVDDSVTEDSTNKHLATIMANAIDALVVGDKVKAVTTEYYANPIVVLSETDPDEDAKADKFANENNAITIYMKRDANLETDRDILKSTTVVKADEHYGVALSNDSKVVLAKIKA